MRTYRRIAAIGLAVSVVALTSVLLSPWHASATGPASPSLPDFTGGVPYQEFEPSTWDFDVDTGGLQPGDTVVLRFDYKNAPPDHLHAVALGTLNRGSITIADYPVDAARPTGCVVPPGVATQNAPHSVKADPYGQTITIVVDAPGFQAGHLLQFCIGGGIGFPVTPDTSGNYGISYQEPTGAPVRVAYNVTPQGGGAAAPASHQIHVTDTDGYELTNAGIGGGRLLSYGTTYALSITGSFASTYQYTIGYQGDAKLSVLFGGTSTTTAGGVQTCPNPPGEPSQQIFCTDGAGSGTGVLKITSDQPDQLAYVTFIGRELSKAAGATPNEKGPDMFSVTVGPPNAPPPTPKATPTPGSSSSGSPIAAPFDGKCVSPFIGNAGLGSLEVYEANTVAITRAFAEECPQIAGQVTFTGVNDSVALNQLLGTLGTHYAFAGLDRAVSHQEYVNCTAQTGPPCDNNGTQSGNTGIFQFPIDLQPLVITYNLPNSPACQAGTLQVSSRLVSAIFSGVVTHWNDPLVTAENSGLSGCNQSILVAHETGTASAILKDYLSKQNPQWNAFKDPAAAEAWPVTAPSSCTANGSDAMALCVLGRPGTIGYGFYHAIHRAGLPIANVATTAGGSQPLSYYTGSPVDGCYDAAQTYPAIANPQGGSSDPLPRSDWSAISLTDSAQGYPICTFNFVVTATNICRSNVINSNHGVMAYLGSAISAYTQRKLYEQGYSELPPNVVQIDNDGMAALGSGGCT